MTKRFLHELKRTHFNGTLDLTQLDQEVILMGWVHIRRDHGGVIFIDLRDLHGITQVVFDPTISKEAHQVAEQVRNEFCLAVRGRVRRRPEGMVNSRLKTGAIEVAVEQIEIFSQSPPPPFTVEDETTAQEPIRLEYRFLDLRRPKAQSPLLLRAKLNRILRSYLDENEFHELETPYLTKSTPEGARDFLVPSRLYPGEAYALPQSPQLFKQLLMMSGFERYYQIVRCFRDEDLRADRQPEFTQLDLELSFVTQEDVFQIMEGLWKKVWKEILGLELQTPFLRMPYREAIEKYGSDKPDLRLDWQLKTATSIFAKCEFKVFREAFEKNLLIQVLRVPKASTLSRKDLDDLTPLTKPYGSKGIAWVRLNQTTDFANGWQSPISKFFSEAEKKSLLELTGAENDDLLIFCADSKKIVADSLSFIRLHLGRKLGALKENEWKFLWVVDFPMFQWDESEKRWVSEHHPFTAPKPEFLETFQSDPGKAYANCYDLVLNGSEMGSGSIRIHQAPLQKAVFELLGISPEDQQIKFGFLLDALTYGAPPHGGVAFGIDRFAMLLAGRESLREVIAFPKTQRGQCPLTKAPSKIDSAQWKELHLRPILTPTT